MEERRLAAIMFSDIAGYTALMGKDEQKAIALVKKSREFQKEYIKQYNGLLIDDPGDAVLACFNSASEAVHCAIEIIKASKQEPELDLHVGIHLGEIIFSDEKLYGDGVNIAARIDTVAKAGEICVSEDVWKNLRNKSDLKAEPIGKRNFKNVSETVCVYRIVTDEDPAGKNYSPLRGFPKSIFNSRRKTIIFTIVILLLLVAGYFGLSKKYILFHPRGALEKSVAVLPFKNESPDPGNEYICNGIMEQIILYLQKIEGFRVPSRTTIEPFRDSSEGTQNIAKDLGVANILEGTVQKSGKNIQVIVRLVQARTDDILWQDSFQKDISDIFEVQRDIAIQVAYALNASLSKDEKKSIREKKPAVLSAYNYYLQARDNLISYDKGLGTGYLDKAVDLFNKAILIDSTYADAYTGLGLAYWYKHYWNSYMSGNFLDSVMYLADKALSFNQKSEEAYWLRSQYESETGNFNMAITEINHALKINPNYSLALWFKGWLEIWYKKDFASGLKILQSVVQFEHGPQLPSMLRNLGYIYFQLGLYDISRKYNLDYAGMSGDSSKYYLYMTEKLRFKGEYDKTEKFLQKLYVSDLLHLDYLFETGWIEMMKKNYHKSLMAFHEYDSISSFSLNHMLRLGYLYQVTGDRQKAKDYFNEQIIVCSENIKLGRWYATQFKEAYYDLAGIYFFTGDKEEGFKYLNEFGNQVFVPYWMIEQMKTDPLFESVRNTEEFEAIISRFTEQGEKEQARVRQMLQDEGYWKEMSS